MKVAEFTQSWVGKALIATALFAAGYYFPLFGSVGRVSAPAVTGAASASASAPSPPR
jgi:hypothetical protein